MNKHKEAEVGNTNLNTTNYNANNDIPPNYEAVAGGMLDNRANEPTPYTHPSAPNMGWGNPNIPNESAAAPPPPVVVYVEDYEHHGLRGHRGHRGHRGGRGGRGRRFLRMYNVDQVPPEYAKCFRFCQFFIFGLAFTTIIIISVVLIWKSFP